MISEEDDVPKRNKSHQVGDDISSLSLQDLDERIALLLVEIERLQQEKLAKQSSMSAADAVFKL